MISNKHNRATVHLKTAIVFVLALCGFCSAVRAEEPASQPATKPASGVVVLGTVTLADGITPVTKASVLVLDADETGIPRTPLKLRLTAPLNAVGAFMLNDRLPSGTYIFEVMQESEAVHVPGEVIVRYQRRFPQAFKN